MTLQERKVILLKVIRKLEDRLVSLRYCEYDGAKPREQRDAEIEVLQGHLRSAHSALALTVEEELAA